MRIYQAQNFTQRLLGLAWMQDKMMQNHEALCLESCTSVHTFGMFFDLDLVFLSQDNRVLGLRKGLKPNRVSFSPKGTAKILEFKGKSIEMLGISLAESIEFDSITRRNSHSI
jgi:uncharacterized membrane protein (UPF0127 family)